MKPIKSILVSVSGHQLTDTEKYLLNRYNPLGVTLFLRNIDTPKQIKNLINEIKTSIERDDVLIAIDQEGGRVARLQKPYFREYLAQKSIGLLDNSVALEMARLQALLISDELNDMGINLNYAPCVDVLNQKTGLVLKSRCFSDDEKKVADLGSVMLDSYHQKGIISCIKHAPGHGLASVDPHLSLPVIDEDLSVLQKDFYPFKMLSKKTTAMMTAHILLTAIDKDFPVTQSKKAIDELIRSEIGFDGFLISDAVDMHALKGSLSEKVCASLSAGCDAVCYCMGKTNELEEVLSVASFLTDKSLERFSQMKQILGEKKAFIPVGEDLLEKYSHLSKLATPITDDYDAVEVLNKLQG